MAIYRNRVIRYDLLIFILAFLLLVAPVSTDEPPETECFENPDNPACQEPVYADDQAEYFYDLRASWVFNDGIPDSSGHTVFHGGAAGNLTHGLTSDTASSDTKTEYYIDNPGEAEDGAQTPDGWGRGSVSSTILLSNAQFRS